MTFNRKNPKAAGKAFIQGDVPAMYVDALPNGAVKCKDNVIALGEVTGHSHVVEGGTKYVLGNQVFVVVEEGQTALQLHNKHDAWILNPGVIQYTDARGTMQREYLGDEERRVLD